MDFDYSAKVKELEKQVRGFMDAHVYPNELTIQAEINKERWQQPPTMEALKVKAKAAGLWNLFLPGK